MRASTSLTHDGQRAVESFAVRSIENVKVGAVRYGRSVEATIPAAFVILILENNSTPTVVNLQARVRKSFNSRDAEKVIHAVIIGREDIGNFGVTGDYVNAKCGLQTTKVHHRYFHAILLQRGLEIAGWADEGDQRIKRRVHRHPGRILRIALFVVIVVLPNIKGVIAFPVPCDIFLAGAAQ